LGVNRENPAERSKRSKRLVSNKIGKVLVDDKAFDIKADEPQWGFRFRNPWRAASGSPTNVSSSAAAAASASSSAAATVAAATTVLEQ
jgi:hypothetical protein